jgi:hypothetical protein
LRLLAPRPAAASIAQDCAAPPNEASCPGEFGRENRHSERHDHHGGPRQDEQSQPKQDNRGTDDCDNQFPDPRPIGEAEAVYPSRIPIPRPIAEAEAVYRSRIPIHRSLAGQVFGFGRRIEVRRELLFQLRRNVRNQLCKLAVIAQFKNMTDAMYLREQR